MRNANRDKEKTEMRVGMCHNAFQFGPHLVYVLRRLSFQHSSTVFFSVLFSSVLLCFWHTLCNYTLFFFKERAPQIHTSPRKKERGSFQAKLFVAHPLAYSPTSCMLPIPSFLHPLPLMWLDGHEEWTKQNGHVHKF